MLNDLGREIGKRCLSLQGAESRSNGTAVVCLVAFYRNSDYWQTSETVTLLKGVTLVSTKAMLMLSPAATEKTCVVSRQPELLPLVVPEQVIAVAAWFL